MAKEIYNEGRVVGYSAYEQYRKILKEQDPDATPANEREWLASSLFMGSSLLIKITRSDVGVFDIPLPDNSALCSATTIIGSWFDGDIYGTNSEITPTGANSLTYAWATAVGDYGSLIANNATSHPNGEITEINTNTIPINNNYDTAKQLASFKSYLKVTDAIVLQTGTWSDADIPQTLIGTKPNSDFAPDLSGSAVIRVRVSSAITEPTCILLTGFSDKAVVSGESGMDSSLQLLHPENGDFLGAACYPWANKVILTISAQGLEWLNSDITLALEDINGDGQEPYWFTATDGDGNKFYTISCSDGTTPYSLDGSGSGEVVPFFDFSDIPTSSSTLPSSLGYTKTISLTWNDLVNGLYQNYPINIVTIQPAVTETSYVRITPTGSSTQYRFVTTTSSSPNLGIGHTVTYSNPSKGVMLAFGSDSENMYNINPSTIPSESDWVKFVANNNKYNCDITWEDLIKSLQNEKKLRLQLDLTPTKQNYIELDVGRVFCQSKDNANDNQLGRIDYFFRYGATRKVMPFGIVYDGMVGNYDTGAIQSGMTYYNSKLGNIGYGGLVKVILRIYEPVGGIGKCELIFNYYMSGIQYERSGSVIVYGVQVDRSSSQNALVINSAGIAFRGGYKSNSSTEASISTFLDKVPYPVIKGALATTLGNESPVIAQTTEIPYVNSASDPTYKFVANYNNISFNFESGVGRWQPKFTIKGTFAEKVTDPTHTKKVIDLIASDKSYTAIYDSDYRTSFYCTQNDSEITGDTNYTNDRSKLGLCNLLLDTGASYPRYNGVEITEEYIKESDYPYVFWNGYEPTTTISSIEESPSFVQRITGTYVAN